RPCVQSGKSRSITENIDEYVTARRCVPAGCFALQMPDDFCFFLRQHRTQIACKAVRRVLCGVAIYKHALLYRISVLLSSFAKIPAEAAGKKVTCSQKNAIDEYPNLLYNIK
ncbi:MAG: hypothetical protein MSH13_00545, partial [Ruminococcus callidus]|nr:hypothetical protein [Ruminococcus callidus]